MEHLPSNKYPNFFKAILEVAEAIELEVNLKGKILDQSYWSAAKELGIKKPYLVKMLVAEVNIRRIPKIEFLINKVGIFPERIAAMAVGYSIIIHPNFQTDKNIIMHELRHVAQFIACGSLKSYLDCYLMEISYFGYGYGPLENDANYVSRRSLLH